MKDVKPQPLAQEEEKTDAVKDVKKLVEAFSAVFRHQNGGQEPKQEDIAKFLAENSQEEQPTEEMSKEDSPSVLKYKVIFGKTSKPLFFNDGAKYFDCHSEQWHDEAPSVISELNERPITTADLYYAIMHGLVNDMDYERLSEKKLVPQESQKLYEKLKKLNDTVEQLKMSHGESLEKAYGEDEFDSAGTLPLDISSLEDDSFEIDDQDFSHFPTEEIGTDVVAEIMRLAMEEGLAPELEAAIRRIVREEIAVASQSQTPVEPVSDEQIQGLEIK